MEIQTMRQTALEQFDIGPARLIQGDAMRVLDALEPGSVDALITDPPYSSGGMTAGARTAAPSSKYSVSGIYPEFLGDNRDQRSWYRWMSLWLSVAQRSLKEGSYALVFTDWRQLPTATDALQAAGFIWRGIIAWDKTEGARAPHKGYFRTQCEYVVWGTKGRCPTAKPGPWPGCLRYPVKASEKLHMTGKPVPLMERLVECVDAGSLILDPFMGSASTGVAALRKGRRFIGVEMEPAYFEVARKRLAQVESPTL